MYYWQSQTVIHVASATNILMSIVYLVTATVTLTEWESECDQMRIHSTTEQPSSSGLRLLLEISTEKQVSRVLFMLDFLH